MHSSIYQPQEDSYLMLEAAKEFASGDVLEIGCGSGIIADCLSRQSDKISSITASDINKKAIEYCQRHLSKKVKWIVSDLFSNITGKYHTIIFNPPYLPNLKNEPKEIAQNIAGGKQGNELILRFLEEAPEFLKPDGKILMLISSLSNKNKIEEKMQELLLDYKIIKKKSMFFEQLYVYLITTSDLKKTLSQKGYTNIKRFTMGKRGIIYTAIKNRKKYAIKVQRPDIAVSTSVNNEARVLKKLNKHNIGPKVIETGKNFFIYEFVTGTFIGDFIKTAPAFKIKKVIILTLNQLRALDKLKLNKKELTNPYKHIIIQENPLKVIMLDFERCRQTDNPKNITQFCQYLCSNYIYNILQKKDIIIDCQKIRRLAKTYKHHPTEENFKKILSLFK